jgi:hypothetical protein
MATSFALVAGDSIASAVGSLLCRANRITAARENSPALQIVPVPDRLNINCGKDAD